MTYYNIWEKPDDGKFYSFRLKGDNTAPIKFTGKLLTYMFHPIEDSRISGDKDKYAPATLFGSYIYEYEKEDGMYLCLKFACNWAKEKNNSLDYYLYAITQVNYKFCETYDEIHCFFGHEDEYYGDFYEKAGIPLPEEDLDELI